MSDELLLRDARDGGVVVLSLNRPPLHPLSMAVLGEIEAAATELAADPDLKAVVVTGGEQAFAAGADVAEFTEPGVAPRISAAFRGAFDALGAIPRPVIAAIEGFALGGGLELALACDLRVAGDGARLGFPEIQLGIFPGAGGTQRAARLIGPARTKELVWTGRHVKAPEALELGLVDRVVPAGTALDAAVELADVARHRRGRRDGPRQARDRRRARRLARRGPRPRGRGVRGGVRHRGRHDGHPQLPRRRPGQGHLPRAAEPSQSGHGARRRSTAPPPASRCAASAGSRNPAAHRPVGGGVPRGRRTSACDGYSAGRASRASNGRRGAVEASIRRRAGPEPDSVATGASTCGVRTPPSALPCSSRATSPASLAHAEARRVRRRRAVGRPTARARRRRPPPRSGAARR